MVTLHEKAIVEGCIEGNREAQKVLYDHFAAKMLALCFRYCDSVEEAEDVLQDAFIRIFTHIRSYRGKGSLEGWIRRIMINTALNHLKSISGHRFSEDIDELSENMQPSVRPAGDMEVKDLIEKIRELPPGYRTVFNLYEVEGFSHKEIADMLRISVNTSKSQLMKAKRMLQIKLDEYIKP